jgi:hypothetical protein
VEAALHCLEAKDYFDRSERGMRIVMTPRGPSVVHAPPSSAAADLPIPLTDMHVAGFFRGIGSAFDCAGAAMVGVLPLRARIQYADFGKARLALSKIRDESEGQRLQVSFRSKLEAGEQECGPAGWLTWTIDYRNALVHKARRLLAVEVGLRSGLLDARGDPILRTIHHPPRDPAFSEVDMWRDPDRADALSEDATTTMDGVLASAVRLIELLARGLLDVWRIRRSDPSLLAQPAEKQWPDDTRPTPTGFPGYSPGEWPYTPAALVASGEVLHRISAAALPDASRDKVWK